MKLLQLKFWSCDINDKLLFLIGSQDQELFFERINTLGHFLHCTKFFMPIEHQSFVLACSNVHQALYFQDAIGLYIFRDAPISYNKKMLNFLQRNARDIQCTKKHVNWTLLTKIISQSKSSFWGYFIWDISSCFKKSQIFQTRMKTD